MRGREILDLNTFLLPVQRKVRSRVKSRMNDENFFFEFVYPDIP